MPNSFIFDSNKCTGCHACRLACTIENELTPESSWRKIETFNPRHHPSLPLYHLSLACNHCSEPACMYACPAAAYSRDPMTGAVLLDEAKCIGCRYCSWACPYDAPLFDPARGVMSKCTFCNHRLREGLKPACAALCPTGALDFADLPEEKLGGKIAGLPETQLEPRIFIKPLDSRRRLPLMAVPRSLESADSQPASPTSDISLRSEWSLVGFTTTVAALVGMVTARLSGAFMLDPRLFAGLAVAALGLATLHLGRPGRAFRALLNLRRSWLSREALAVSSFIALAAAYLWLTPDRQLIGSLAVITGLLALVCADQVYSVLGADNPGYRHSASVIWTGFYLAGIFAGRAWLAGVFGLGKSLLYLFRKMDFAAAGRPSRPLVSAARLAVGFIIPFSLWLLDREGTFAYVVACAVIGEAIDRCEYYDGLETESPRRRMAVELQAQAADLSIHREPAAAD